MIAGDSKYWDDFFSDSLIPLVVEHVLETWEAFEKPEPDEHENVTSRRFYCALMSGKNRNKHAFLIRHEDMEVDVDLAIQTGRKDIVFFPGHEECIYFCLEAKRLNAMVNGVMTALSDEYVKEGMQRFVDRRYSKHVCHGGMLGYVLDGDVDRAIANVGKNLVRNCAVLWMTPPGGWTPSAICPADVKVKETLHNRPGDASPFRIHHLFVKARELV